MIEFLFGMQFARRRKMHFITLRRLPKMLLSLTSLATVAVAIDPSAKACDPVQNQPFVLQPEQKEQDKTAPGAVKVMIEKIELDDATGSGDCSGLDVVILAVSLEDNNSAYNDVGYELLPVGGDAVGDPPLLGLSPVPVEALDGRIYLQPYIPEGTEHLNATIAVRAVDRAGNAGKATEVQISSEVASGCSVTGHRRSPLWPAGIVGCAMALAYARRRRRPRV